MSSLSTKIALLIAGLLLTLGAVMILAFTVLSEREINRTIESNASSAGTQLNRLLASKADRLESLTHYAASGDARVRGLVLTGDAETVEEEAPRLAKEFAVDAVQVTDGTGRLLGSSGLPEAGSRSLEPGGFLPIRAELYQNQIYLVATRPVSYAGEQKGFVRFFSKVGDADAAALAEGSGLQVAFVTGGTVVATSVHPMPHMAPKDRRAFRVALKGEEYVGWAQPATVGRLSAPFRLIALQQTQKIVAPYRQAQIAFGAILVVALACSIWAGLWFGRSLIRPLDALVSAAETISHGCWPEPFAKTGSDEIGLLQVAFNDMTSAAKASQERLLAMVDLDPLTDLMNHRRFRERLAHRLTEVADSRQNLVVVLCDIDSFGAYNDTHGHTAGDSALQTVSEALRLAAPEGSDVARYRAGAFALAIPDTDTSGAVQFGTALRAQMRLLDSPVSVSIGIAEFPTNSERAEGLVLAAELASARAKQLGHEETCAFASLHADGGEADPFQLYASMENGSFATIAALAAAVDAKDTYTRGHSERVARYAKDLAAASGQSWEEQERIYRCGTLHDVGKIGIPDEILKKPGRLEPEEMRIMETHVVLGEMIVSKVPRLSELLPGVRHHHERWDGKGYPDRIAGEAIPLMARILAIADTFDAMTSDRPYRKGMDVDIALAEIERNAGHQFDPELAPIFVWIKRAERTAKAA